MTEFLSPLRSLRPWQLALWAAALALQLGFSIGGVSFARIGVPLRLPEAAGGLAHFQPKLFVTEFFLGFVLAAALWRWRQLRWDFRRRPLLILVGAVLVWGAARILYDLRENPVTVVRNSAFVWYLALPMLLWALHLPLAWFANWIRVFLLAYTGLVLSAIVLSFFTGAAPVVFWSADIGLVFLVGFGLLKAKPLWGWLSLLLAGFSFGLVFHISISRTMLLGVLLTPLALALIGRIQTQMPKVRWMRLFGLPLGFGLGLAVAVALSSRGSDRGASWDTIREVRPLVKGEHNSVGMEKFRYYLWHDAGRLFLQHPLFGVGFVRPVVERVYWFTNVFMPNDGSPQARTKNEPPVAGPHNSYLNALARLGLPGLLFVVIHGLICLIFIRRKCWMALSLFFGQALYSVFNVGLEGPVRSFLLLILCGYALTLEQAEKEDPPEDMALG